MILLNNLTGRHMTADIFGDYRHPIFFGKLEPAGWNLFPFAACVILVPYQDVLHYCFHFTVLFLPVQ